MSEHISRCYRCLAPNPAWGMTICAACRQVEAIEKQTEQANELAEERAYQLSAVAERNARIQQEQARIQEDQHWEAMQLAKLNAELAREQAAQNARLTAEGGVNSDDALKFGLYSGQDYIDSDQFGASNGKITIELTESGDIDIRRLRSFKPYMMDHLLQAYDRGLKSSIKKFKKPGFEYMKKQAYSAGLNLQSEFRMDVCDGSYTTRKGEAAIIFSTEYDADLRRSVDTATGYVRYIIQCNPFKTAELNEMYSKGVEDAQASENTDEEINNRLKTEVLVILAEQERAQKQQEILKQLHAEQLEINAQRAIEQYKQQVKDGKEALALFVILLVGIAFMVSMLWMVDHGFIAFVTLLGGAWLAVYQWWNDYSTDNLRKKYESGLFAKSMLE